MPPDHVTNNLDCNDENPDDDLLVLTETLSGMQDHRAIFSLTSTSILTSDSDILFQAGNTVSLNELFEVNLGGVLEVQIDSCSN